ncbi:helix-turn-helix domain-containing protein [Streptomyces aidingensis]|uniref:AraC-type DNA-binding protein n=1 Tax=Streptomyces aidingensis TaxID=910347 RepID=A0A1I1IQW0_9ACTN|nr:helix-turn-helix domain-containing protein [Streptomyces aidingensis]SFC35620.1 AraC-type DNA-binding protein [Streptomyces aidingensis]
MVETLIESRSVPRPGRFSWWCEITGNELMPTRITSEAGDDFHGTLRIRQFGAVRLTWLHVGQLTSTRTPRTIRQGDPEEFPVVLAVRGRQGISQARREAEIRPGELMVFDTSRPFASWVGPAAGSRTGLVIAHIPKALLPLPADRIGPLVAAPRPPGGGLHALLSDTLARLALGPSGDDAPPASRGGPGTDGPAATEWRAADAARLGNIVLDLTAAWLAHEVESEAAVPAASHQEVLLLRIRGFIQRHLGDPGLGPDMIAGAHHISTRYLHRLFEGQETTVTALIRQERLRRCRRDLADPALRDSTVAALAARWGFAHAADFSRSFRAAYGMPPSAYRRAALRSGPDTGR